MTRKYKKHDSTWYDSQDRDHYYDNNSFEDDMRYDEDRSIGDLISDFIEDTYGLGIVILALGAIAIPLAAIQVVIFLIDKLF